MEKERENLSLFFKELQNRKKDYIKSSRGRDFEELIMNGLDKYSFNKLINDNTWIFNYIKSLNDRYDIKEIKKSWENLKEKALNKYSLEIIKNPFPELKSNYLWQPFGSQQFPDFIIFCGTKIFLVETKFTKAEQKPVWNSNLPKSSSIYIFGAANKNLTFFKGSDFLGDETRNMLNSFFEPPALNSFELLNSMREKLEERGLLSIEEENAFGLCPYIRKAFQYSKNFQTSENNDIFDSTRNNHWENNVIDLIKGF